MQHLTNQANAGHSLLLRSIFTFWLFVSSSFHLQAAPRMVEIDAFQSVRGEIVQLENLHGESLLRFADNTRITFPSVWRETSVVHVIPLSQQTAVLLSSSEPGCGAQMSLVVIDATVVWGPYAVGRCNDTLAYQRSDDSESLVAFQLNGTNRLAWVYSADEHTFHGPSVVTLPSRLLRMAQPLSTIEPKDSLIGNEALVPARKSVKSSIPSKLDAKRRRASTPPLRPASASHLIDPLAPPPFKAPPTRPSVNAEAPELTPLEAKGVSDDVKRAGKTQKRLVIDLT